MGDCRMKMANCDLVIKVISGNALEICFHEVIILDGVDAPDVFLPEGEAAREKLSELALNKKMNYREEHRDECDRIIAQAWVGGKNINKEMMGFIKKLNGE